jgi:glycogenin glucosyltransferase
MTAVARERAVRWLQEHMFATKYRQIACAALLLLPCIIGLTVGAMLLAQKDERPRSLLPNNERPMLETGWRPQPQETVWNAHSHEAADVLGAGIFSNKAVSAVKSLARIDAWDVQSISGPPAQVQSVAGQQALLPSPVHDCAIATVVLGDWSMEAARVWLYSLRATNTALTPICITLSGKFALSERNMEQLRSLGAQVLELESIEYHLRRSAADEYLHRDGRFAKFYAWALTGFKKVVYTDLDVLFLKKPDELCTFPAFSAMPDSYPWVFNTGVMVISPSKATFDQILNQYRQVKSYNGGDQGVINVLLGAEFQRASSEMPLPRGTNFFARLFKRVIYPTLVDFADIWLIHYTSATKPWNFYQGRQAQIADLPENFEMFSFYLWRMMSNAVPTSGVAAAYGSTARRQLAVCDSFLQEFRKTNNLGKLSPRLEQLDREKVTVILSTYSRFEFAERLINHVLQSKLVDRVLVVWHNPNSTPPRDRQRVFYLRQEWDSLNNRFNPTNLVRTTHCVQLDDDIMFDISDFDFLVETAVTHHSEQLVGVYARYAERLPDNSYHYHTSTFEERAPSGHLQRPYNVMLTKLLVLPTKYLFAYTCLLPPQIHFYIDEHMNCEDIAMNILVQGMTGRPPVHVDAVIQDFGTDVGVQGISTHTNHLDMRSMCVQDLMRLMNNDGLATSYTSVSRYKNNRYVKKHAS